MELTDRIEQPLIDALNRVQVSGCPPRLAEAMRYSVFPGGARIRPRLCLAVAQACGKVDATCADAAAASVELMHCASLIHDDLPCFDDAEMRRGKAAVHVAYGQRIAVLAGDALIVLAFQTLARGMAHAPERLATVSRVLGRSVGMPFGIVAGQAWECEPEISLEDYQRAKTGALFAAATVTGAASAGMDPEPWRTLGEKLGEAYQVADDLRDVVGDPSDMGKPANQDALHGRPSAALSYGVEGATERLEKLVEAAIDSIPDCPGQEALRKNISVEAWRFLSRALTRRAA
ncbi:MAG: polyprenyl synthetase family protein [Pseudomonadota bacterium]